MPSGTDTVSTGIKWNEVTWYSKLGAFVVIFGVLPALSFYIGQQYEQVMYMYTPPTILQIHRNPSNSKTSSNPSENYSDSKTEETLQQCENAPDAVTTRGNEQCLAAALTSYQSLESAKYDAAQNSIKNTMQKVIDSSPDMKHYYDDALAGLQKSEIAWKSYSDSMCSVTLNLWTTGTGAPGADVACQIELLKKHIQDLATVNSGF